MPDLSSSPSPSVIIRSYCFFAATRERQIETHFAPECERDSAVFWERARWRKSSPCSRFCMSSPSVSSTREAHLAEDFTIGSPISAGNAGLNLCLMLVTNRQTNERARKTAIKKQTPAPRLSPDLTKSIRGLL